MRTVNLTVIGDVTCSTTRTYLTYLRDAGIRPRRLWLVRFRPAAAGERRVRRLLGATAANWLHRRRAPAPAAHEPPFRDLCAALQETATPRAIDYFAPLDPHSFADKVDWFTAEDFGDPYLQKRMLDTADSAFLYTNGGLVPGDLLRRPEIRVFHVHPGIVPDVRGSDGMLWSFLVRRRLGVSCFYMSAGIDEGAVLGRMEFDVPDLSPLRAHLTPEGEDTAYRALLFAVDPHLRGQLLADVIARADGADLRSLKGEPQPQPARPAYLWMHPRLRLRAMREMAG